MGYNTCNYLQTLAILVNFTLHVATIFRGITMLKSLYQTKLDEQFIEAKLVTENAF